MASTETPLASVLRRYMQERRFGLDRLARASGVPKHTIANWRDGTVERPYYPDQLLRAAQGLCLTKLGASRLLQAAGYPPIDELPDNLRADLRDLLVPWDRAYPTNLPSPPSSFVGRTEEILDIAQRLSERDVRLVTLTGPGGSGKTRLALKVASALLDAFPDGVWFVALAPLTDPDLVLLAVARTLGVREAPGVSLAERLAAYLRERRTLLLLDNFEQVASAGPAIVALLTAAPGLKVLVTSRTVLHVSGEHERPVPPLPLPTGGASLAELHANPAVALFIARARAANPTFLLAADNAPAVAELCARLDGLPLAIELAAARSRHLNPPELLARFPARLALAADGPRDLPTRQRTLRATIQWSCDLLGPDDRVLLARLAVFAGGWTPEAAGAVCQAAGERQVAVADGLAALAESNLVVRDAAPDGQARYGMLETIREYALECLVASEEEEAARLRHAAWCLAVAEPPTRYFPSAADPAWLARLDAERDNLRAALAWALATGRDELLARLAGAAWPYWHERAMYAEAGNWLRRALARTAELPPGLRAPVATGATIIAFAEGDVARGAALGEESAALWEALGEPYWRAVVLLYLAIARQHRADFAGARDAHLASLAIWRSLGDRRGTARCLADLAFLLAIYGHPDEARPYAEEALALYTGLGDRTGKGRTTTDLGLYAMQAGDLARALPLLQAGLAISRATGSAHHLPFALCYLGLALLRAGEPAAAHGHLVESLHLCRAAGNGFGVLYCLIGLAGVAGRLGQPVRAARLVGAAETLHAAFGAVMPPGPRERFEGEVASIRAQIDETIFARARAEGAALPLEQALVYALDSDERDSFPPR